MKQLSTRLIISIFFVIAFSFIGFFVVITFKNVTHTKILNQKTTSSLHALMLTESVLDNIEELNAAQRGYTFTSSKEYRQPHEEAVEKLVANIDSFHAFTGTAKGRNIQVAQIVNLLQEKINDSKNSLQIFDSAGVNAIVEKIRSGVSKKINDSLRSALQQMELSDRAVINNSNQYLEDTAKETSYRFFILSFVFSVILVCFLLLIYFEFKRKEKVAAQLRYQASLIENLPDAIFTTDKNFIVESWNRYAAELYDISGTEATGKVLTSLMTIHNSEEEKKISLAELNKKGFYKAEYLVTKKNKEQIYVLASINTIVNNEGLITGYIAVHRNITERRKLEDSQKEFSKELEKQVKIKTAETTNILERITDGFLALDSNFTFTFVNKKAGEMLGHDPAHMIGKNIFTGFGEISSSVFNDACLTAFKNQQYVFLENYSNKLY